MQWITCTGTMTVEAFTWNPLLEFSKQYVVTFYCKSSYIGPDFVYFQKILQLEFRSSTDNPGDNGEGWY